MPIPYGKRCLPEHDPLSEYYAVRERVGVIDLSHDGQYLLSGEDRVPFLQNLISNDIHLATNKKGIISALLTAKGKVVSRFFLCPLTGGSASGRAGPAGVAPLAGAGSLADSYFLDVESAAAEKTIQHFMKYKMRSKIKIEPLQWGKLLVSGPESYAVLEKILPLPETGEGSFFFQADANPLLVIRTTQTGEDDYHLYCHKEQRDTLWNNLFAAGKEWDIAQVGETTFNILRIEAGIPRYGVDMDEERFPVESEFYANTVSYTKGCYPGQEVMARIKTYGHCNRILKGLIIKGDSIPQRQDNIFKADDGVGWVTSAVFSPFLKSPIALAYLKNGVEEGMSVEVSIHGEEGESQRTVSAVVTKLPFYERGGDAT